MSDETIETSLPCAEKLAFDTIKEAQATATVSEWRHGGKLKVYKCRHCHLYHLATSYADD
ncbi:MAG TPA: hypothetical protein VLG47_04485 [Candidatus Saccharimonadales bacterium]|nr:hypothetical protein [Candidatus Saccharimonadales bacterium]